MFRRALELEKQIAEIQKSTKTLFRVFAPLHNWFRMHSKLYYDWSLKSYAKSVHWAVLFLCICSLPGIFYSTFRSPQFSKADEPTYDFPRWEWVNPPSQIQNGSNKMTTCPNGSVWAVGAFGAVLKSSDNGKNWQQIYTGADTSDELVDITCVDANIFVLSLYGEVRHYDGISWTLISNVNEEDYDSYSSITATDPNHVLVVGNKIFSLTNTESSWETNFIENELGSYVVTIDPTHALVFGAGEGGKVVALTFSPSQSSWTTSDASIGINSSYAIAVDQTHVLASGYGSTLVALTYNGSSWNKSVIDNGSYSSFSKIIHNGVTHVIAVGSESSTIGLTLNGSSWGSPTTISSDKFDSAVVTDETHVLAISSSKIAYFNFNGSSWSSENWSVSLDYGTNFMVSADPTHAVAMYGITLSYNGSAWIVDYAPTSIEGLNYLTKVDDTKTLAVGDSGHIASLTYNGSSWDVAAIDSGVDNNYNDVVSTDSTHAIAVGNSGQITALLYQDESWHVEPVNLSGVTNNFTSAAVVDHNTVLTVGSSGKVMVLSYNGATWIPTNIEDTGVTQGLQSIIITDKDADSPSHALAVGSTGRIISITKSGLSWTAATITSNTENDFRAIAAIDFTHALAVGYLGQITTLSLGDSGWVAENVPMADGFGSRFYEAIAIADSRHALAVDSNGRITALAYNGSSWTETNVANNTNYNFQSILAVNSTYALVGGTRGVTSVAYLYDSLQGNSSWSVQRVNDFVSAGGITFKDIISANPTNIFTAGAGNILSYISPANAIARRFLVSAANQNFTDEINPNITGMLPTARAGVNYPVKVYAVDGSESPKLDRGVTYSVALSTSDPNDSNPASIYLNNGLSTTDYACNSDSSNRINNPCGIGTANIVFHTAGVWSINADDASPLGVISSGILSNVTVMPGVPQSPRFSSASITSGAGVASKVTLGLADLYNNATSDEEGDRVIRLSSSSKTGRFSSSSLGPWLETLNVTVPTGDAAISPEENKTTDFYYLDFKTGVYNITASGEGLTEKNLSSTIIPGMDLSGSTVSIANTSLAAGSSTQVLVMLKDSSGNPVPGKMVRLYSSREGDTISPNEGASTGSNGEASFSISTIKSGSFVLSVKDETDNTWLSGSINMTCVPGAVNSILLEPSLTEVSTGISFNIRISLLDQYGNIATNSDSQMLFSSSDQEATLPDSHKFDSSDLGIRLLDNIILKTAGNQKIIAQIKDTDIKSEINIKANPSSFSIVSSSFNTNKNKLVLGKDKATFHVLISDEFGNGLFGKSVSISSDDDLGSIVGNGGITDKNGNISFDFVPEKTGKTIFVAHNETDNAIFGSTIEIEIMRDTIINNTVSLIDTFKHSEIIEKLAKIATPIVNVTAAIGLLPFVANLLGSLPAALHGINYSVSLALEAMGIRKRRKNWGRVYDSTTGKGIDLALVRLYNQKNMALAGTMVTDLKGRYHFSAEPGVYTISVTKQAYIFPTQIFAKYSIASINRRASLVNAEYVGQPINITKENDLLNIDIPIDPIKKNLEFSLKVKIFFRGLINFASYELSKFFVPVLIFGSVVSVFSAVVDPNRRNIIVAIIYVVIIILFVVTKLTKSRYYSKVISKNGKPVEGVIVSIFDKEYNTLKESRATDRYGRFSIYAPKGSYYLKAEKEGYIFDLREFSKTNNNTKEKKGKFYKGELIVLNKPAFIRETIMAKK